MHACEVSHVHLSIECEGNKIGWQGRSTYAVSYAWTHIYMLRRPTRCSKLPLPRNLFQAAQPVQTRMAFRLKVFRWLPPDCFVHRLVLSTVQNSCCLPNVLQV